LSSSIQTSLSYVSADSKITNTTNITTHSLPMKHMMAHSN
jgi:hypothetical protein